MVLNTLFFGPVVAVACSLDRDAKLAYRISLGWIRLNLWVSGCRLHVRGLENVSRSEQYVFMSNHLSNADIVAIAWALRDFQLRWVAKKELLRVPVFGWALRTMGNVIIDRSNRMEAIRTYAAASERIARGICLMVFPEGTRGHEDGLLPFKKGSFMLALETGTPIVPVGVVGTARILPRTGWQVERGEVEVVIGRPIPTAGRAAERDQVMKEVRAAIAALAGVAAEAPAVSLDAP
ncbi:MAG: 1-acyl-sn-glycerol-3-phosphate acyltransferase [Candidatus Binatota bacterium]|nr:1-acyl-sn-glycerol-3-phosphate acyltransferase [Candidatus Binatota bacterium]